MIYIVNKRRKLESIIKEYPNAEIVDVTSSSKSTYRLLSPFFPHGNIPIPGMPDQKAMSVEGIWQGLKVFENHDIDYALFQNDSMKGLKRTARKFGNPIGHKYYDELLSYLKARKMIYLPSYKYVLEKIPSVTVLIEKIKEISTNKDVVLLDYNTNIDIYNTTKPLSHAGLIKLFIEDNYPL